MKHLFLLLLISLQFFSCFTAEKLTLRKEFYSGNMLSLDGYYYREIEKDFYEIFFLYRDGIFLSGGAMRKKGHDTSLDDSVRNFAELGFYKNIQYGWGIWKIQKDQLIIEKWLSGVGGSYPVGRYIGDIVNDTTVKISFTYQIPPKDNEEKFLFSYKKFHPKPDSTNVFIE